MPPTRAEARRPIDHGGPQFEPPGWWETFWQRHFADTAQMQEEAVAMLRKLLEENWADRTEAEAEEAIGRYFREDVPSASEESAARCGCAARPAARGD